MAELVEPGDNLVDSVLNIDRQQLSIDLSILVAATALSLAFTLWAVGCRWWLLHPMLIYCDQGLFVSMAQLLLEGRIPYVDMFDVNPPLAIYMQIPPVVLSRLCNIPVTLAFSLYVYGINLVSYLLLGWVMYAARRTGAIVVIACALVGFAYFNQIQRLDFGQREHIFVLLYLPFMMLRYLRWQNFALGRWQAIAVGVFAGIGLAFKPHFILMACAPELAWFLRSGKLRHFVAVEVLAAAAVIIVYLLHFLFLPAVELQAFFNFVVPIYKEGYSYYVTSPIYNMATYWRNDFLLLAATSLIALALARISSLALGICAFSFMSALVYALAGQDWSCHMVAVRTGNFMAIAVESALIVVLIARCQKLQKLTKSGSLQLTAVALSAAGIIGGGTYLSGLAFTESEEFKYRQPYPLARLGYFKLGMGAADDMDPFCSSCLENSVSGESVLFICASMAPGYPLMLQTNRRPASRFLHGMMLPILSFIIDRPDLDDKTKERFRRDKEQVIAWYAEDIQKNKPRLIYIQDNPMNWVFERSNFIKKQMSEYKKIETKDGISIYKRND